MYLVTPAVLHCMRRTIDGGGVDDAGEANVHHEHSFKPHSDIERREIILIIIIQILTIF